jgi:hypothetical protein
MLPDWLAKSGLQNAKMDLVLYAGHVGELGAGTLDPIIVHTLSQLVGHGFQTVALASAAAPKDFSALPRGAKTVARLDWLLWQQVCSQSPHRLDYGDFATGHPDMTEPPPFAMGTISVRYALDTSWLLIKGNQTSGAGGKPMHAQYTAHAKSLAKSTGFGGLETQSWADKRIEEIAAGTPGVTSGSRTTWVEIGVNRHLSLVADRLP